MTWSSTDDPMCLWSPVAGGHGCPGALPFAQQEKTLKRNSNQEPVRSVARWTEILFIVICHLPWQTEPSTASQRVQEKRRMFLLKEILAETAAAELENPVREKKSSCLSTLAIHFAWCRIFLLASWEGKGGFALQEWLCTTAQKGWGFCPSTELSQMGLRSWVFLLYLGLSFTVYCYFLYALTSKVSNIQAEFQESHHFLPNLHNHVYQLSAKLKHLFA